jgi:L,D-peptidoglycan transpeptidase YkuD (ErfK/YbiS/YcfS/YnhG family)
MMDGRGVTLRTFLSRWRWRLFGAGVGLTVAAVGVGCAWPILSGRTDPPLFDKLNTQSALDDARRSGASRWAPATMREAEAATKAAFAAYRLEEVKFLPFRDYRGVRSAIDLAQTKITRAIADGNQHRLEAKTEADQALADAERDTARSSAVGDAMHLGTYNRTLLQKSKIALAEARSIYARGDFVECAVRAREAGVGSRAVSGNAADAAARYADASLVARWNRMVRETIAWSRATGDTAIVVLKENHRVDLYDGGRVIRSYAADMGYRSVNDKLRSGDAATPEGRYRITAKKPGSTYYKALALNYPNAEDRAEFERLRRQGRIPRGASMGGLIEIHGDGGRGKDWTKGCVALANRDMDDLFRRATVGTPVTIVGGDGQGVFARLVREQVSGANARTQ